jgi:hypothetical protein
MQSSIFCGIILLSTAVLFLSMASPSIHPKDEIGPRSSWVRKLHPSDLLRSHCDR